MTAPGMSSRLTSTLLLFLFVALLSTMPRPARSELVHGFLKAYPDFTWFPVFINCKEAFDFSAQTIVNRDSDGADLCFFSFANGSISKWYFKPLAAGLRRENDTSLEDLLLAPSGGYSGHSSGPIELGGVYTILTDDGFYAKFRVHEYYGGCCFITIEYYVQMDGTRNLDQGVPVHSTTWGRVKALYE